MTGADLSKRPPPDAAILLVPGKVMHARMHPVGHRFSYRVFNILIDIDRLAEADRESALFSVGRFNLAGFRPQDHHPQETASIRAHVEAMLTAAGDHGGADRILLWCYPRVLGQGFDPLSIFFVYRDNRLAALVYAVRNTFGERHSYVAPIMPGEADPAGIRQERDKLFYVSPFMDLAQRYHFRITPPGETLTVRILETGAHGPTLAATFAGRPEPMTMRSLVAACLRAPLLGLKIVGGIHYEALKLWLKGLVLQPRPAPPPPFSLGDAPRAAANSSLAGAPRAAFADPR